MSERFDVVIVGGGHNGLTAAALLAAAGRSVLVLERRGEVGGAAVSGVSFPGIGARLSRYAYLVSLFPASLQLALGLDVELRQRRMASYTPDGQRGVLIGPEQDPPTLSPRDAAAWKLFQAMVTRVAERVFPTLTEPLLTARDFRMRIGDRDAWRMLFEEPLSIVLEQMFASDLLRGLVLTDATVGTFAPADDPALRQNRCFVYHVIGNGTGRWDVPVGGMGALTAALDRAARGAGAQVRTGAEVVALQTDGTTAHVRCADGSEVECDHVLANVAPAVLARLLGRADQHRAPEGSQLKVNMLLSRLPRLRDPTVSPDDAFAGTFHVNEGYEQLARAYASASAGQIPEPVPCELYCHSLTDSSILDPDLRAAGAQALTLFALHMPARLFAGTAHAEAKRAALDATLRSVDSVLAEPLEGCLWRQSDGSPCIEALTPVELEQQLAMPGGHIFHGDLSWPFAQSNDDVGRWGVETDELNIWLCGAGARRGGGISGIPGHNAARAVLEAERVRQAPSRHAPRRSDRRSIAGRLRR